MTPITKPTPAVPKTAEDFAAGTKISRPLTAPRATVRRLSDPSKAGLKVFVYGPAGSGKCLGRGTPVMLFSGEIIYAEDIKVGDQLMGPDSTPRNVLSVCQGTGPLYQIIPTKGAPWVCNDAHILSLTGSGDPCRQGKIRDINIEAVINEFGSAAEASKRWKLFRVPVDFTPTAIKFDPYVIGAWIGDGTRSVGAWSLGLLKTGVREYIKSYFEREHFSYSDIWMPDRNYYRITLRRTNDGNVELGTKRTENKAATELWNYLIAGCTDSDGEKLIPNELIRNSRKVRESLLAGILDTDGYFSQGHFELISKSRALAEQYLFLCRSLGLAAYMSEKPVQLISWTSPRTYYRLTISGNFTELPLIRHRTPARKQVKRVSVTGWDAVAIGEGEYFGFQIDGDARFLLGDFTVTHNSTVAKGLLERGFKGIILSTDIGGSGMSAIEGPMRREGHSKELDNAFDVEIGSYEGVKAFLDDPARVCAEASDGFDLYAFDPDFIFWDGFGAFQQIDLMEFVGDMDGGKRTTEQRESGLQLEMRDWGLIKSATIRLLDQFCSLHNRKTGKIWHKIVSAHESIKSKEVSAGNSVLSETKEPLLTGAGGILARGAFDLILKTLVRKAKAGEPGDGGGRVFEYVTAGHENLAAKNRGFDLPAVMPGDGGELFMTLLQQRGLTKDQIDEKLRRA
jgi:hypothetical protein